MTTIDWLALALGLFIGGFVAGYKIIPDRVIREMSEEVSR